MATETARQGIDREPLAHLEKSYKTSTTREYGWPMTQKAITPDTPGHILTDISRMPHLSRFKRELIRGAQARQALMILNQRRLNEANARIQHAKIDGIGQKIASIDASIYAQQMMLHGRDCWQQPDFLDKFLRDNPECRIKHNLPARVSMPRGLEEGHSGISPDTVAGDKRRESSLVAFCDPASPPQ